MILLTAWLGILLAQGESAREGTNRWIEELKSERVETREAAARKLVEAGDAARKAVEEVAGSADLETSARAKEILRRMDSRKLVRGRKLLVSFHGYPVGSPEKGSDNTEAHEKAARDIQDALAKAQVKVLQVIGDSRQSGRRYHDPKKGAVHFEQMLLVECGNRAPEEALAGLPHRRGAIVFDDGAYAKGLPDPETKDGVGPPLPYAFMVWGSFEFALKEADLARYRSLRGVVVEFSPPPPNSGGSAGWVKLTPDPGTTLLEVFLLTRAHFRYEKDR